MKKIICLFITIMLSITGFSFVAGCSTSDNTDYTTVKVSTAEELKSASNSNNYIVLQNNIDLKGSTFSPISCYGLEGNGYTISNAVITSTNEEVSFFSSVNTVSDVTFDKIKIVASSANYVSVVTAYAKQELLDISNVTVQNCSISAVQKSSDPIYVGAILGYGEDTTIYVSGYFVPSSYITTEKISDCKVSDVDITVEGYTGSSSNHNYSKIYVSGICGRADEINNCHVSDCEFTLTSKNLYQYTYAAGIMSYLQDDASITNCSVSGNSINTYSNYYSKNIAAYSGSKTYIGGIYNTGESGCKVSYCSVCGNDFTARSTGAYYIGGIASENYATVSQSYVAENIFVGKSGLDGNESGGPWIRNIGGFFASSDEATINSCFTYGNTMITYYTDGDTDKIDSTASAVGFAKTDTTTVYAYCATANNTINSGSTDEFATANLQTVTKCYITSNSYGNNNNLDIIDEISWLSASTISSLLNLSGSAWTYSGDYPKLIFE